MQNLGESLIAEKYCTLSLKHSMEIGQQVRLRQLCDRAPQEIAKKIGKIGTIQGFKILDGSSIGIVVQFEGQFSTWFFEDELELLPEKASPARNSLSH
jgi:hypothetical protein